MAILDDLEAQVKANTDAEASAVVLINGFAARLQAAKDSGDPARVQAVIDAMKASADKLGAAVVANTPAA